MDKLKGKTIYIGKEQEHGRLIVAVQGYNEIAQLGSPGSVPKSVSRCMPSEGVAHAKISVDPNGDMTLVNMKQQNVTYVNGAEIVSKRITPANVVELGKDRYSISIPTIIEVARKIVSVVPPPGLKKYNISHLEHVWEELQTKKKEAQAKQKRINLVRSGCGIFTMCAMPCIFMFGPVGYVLTGIGILGNIYSFVGLKNDNTSEVFEQMTEEFQEKYSCPNPECNKFLGNISYKFLKKQYSMHCPYCKCEYIEK